jgi:hypothetical protein
MVAFSAMSGASSLLYHTPDKKTLDKKTILRLWEPARCRYGLIGNPVTIGSGPAAVTPPFLEREGNLLGLLMPLFRISEMGRLLSGRGSQKTYLTPYCYASARLQKQIGKTLRVK